MTPAPACSDTMVFQSDLVCIGAFRCDREHPGFHDSGPARHDCFVFPRTAVEIAHEHEPAFAANPNVTTFYNRGQRYVRHGISAHGDRCDWFGISRALALDAVRMAVPGDRQVPFSWTRGPCNPETYLCQRRLFDGVARGLITDPIAIEETVVLLLDRVTGSAARALQRKPSRVVHEVECLLASRFDQPLTLQQIAAHAETSVYHLCRTFREATGLALHQYLRQLRIRNGLENVLESAGPLSRIAVDLGFAHHSHFTSAFRLEFGVTPSQLRA